MKLLLEEHAKLKSQYEELKDSYDQLVDGSVPSPSMVVEHGAPPTLDEEQLDQEYENFVKEMPKSLEEQHLRHLALVVRSIKDKKNIRNLLTIDFINGFYIPKKNPHFKEHVKLSFDQIAYRVGKINRNVKYRAYFKRVTVT